MAARSMSAADNVRMIGESRPRARAIAVKAASSSGSRATMALMRKTSASGSTRSSRRELHPFDEAHGRSECLILDARRLADGPVARIALPHKICSGTHSVWADRRFIRDGVLAGA
jgi:hypothetical protein